MSVCHDGVWITISLHGFSQKLQGSLAILLLRDVVLKSFAFVITTPPEVMYFAVDLDANFGQIPPPLR